MKDASINFNTMFNSQLKKKKKKNYTSMNVRPIAEGIQVSFHMP